MSPEAPRDPRLDEGLERLRALGYLRSPAELFVAEKVSPRASVLRTGLMAGAWVGAGGGVIAGLVLAISVLAAVPQLASSPRELAWLSIDLVVASAVASFLLVTALTVVLLKWKASRRLPWRGGAERVLLLMAILPPALYLADVFGRFLLHRLQGSLWTLAAIAAAMIATLLASVWGRALRALLAAAGMAPLEEDGLLPLRGIRLQTRGLVLVLCAILLLLGPYRGMRALPRLDQVSPVSPRSVEYDGVPLFLTVDGWRMDDLAAALPEDARGRELDAESLPEHPTAFWSTAVTGFDVSSHGLRDASGYAPIGIEAGLENAMRQPLLALVLRGVLPGVGLAQLRAHDQRELLRPPFWEILAHCGVRVSVINQWASYPAARHTRLSVVSDRCFLRMWEGGSTGPDEHLVHPPRDALLNEAQGMLARRAQFPTVVEGDSLLGALPLSGLEEFREAWEYAVAADLFHASLARADREAGDYALVSVHLGGADILLRAAGRVPQGNAREFAHELLELHRRFTVSLIEELSDAGGPFVLVTSRIDDGPRMAEYFSSLPGGSRALLELAPGILEFMGLPPAADMVGAYEELQLKSPGPETWGLRPAWTPEAERSVEDLERLRSLGYIGGD